MARDLYSTPIEDVSFADIQDLTSKQAEEGIRLEFKVTLPTSGGDPDRWIRNQSGIGRVARDEIAKEIVAFANAYGGVVLIRIDETDDSPKRAKDIFPPPIPKVVDCAEQLVRALRGIIDPPLPQLEGRGIPSTAEGDSGVILIRVEASPFAPHGVGKPPAAYVRRGADS